MPAREIIKSLLPKPLLHAVRYFLASREAQQPRDLTQVFTRIYDENVWGKSSDQGQRFYSGSGSHLQDIVSTYVGAVQGFLTSLEKKPDVADLGCGDFNVGSSIRPFCASYTACDIVPSLIEFNKERYRDRNVDFRVLNLADDALPKADVVFIRQVFQHLSNQHILRAIPKIAASYRYLVLTEHLPDNADFVPNRDKPPGAEVRVAFGSGLVLTRPPFDLKVRSERILCEVPEDGPHRGRIRTTAYELS